MKLKLFTAAVTAAVAAAVQADKVTLKSGSTLTGEAGDIAGEELKVKSDDLGEVKIKLASIASLESAKKHTVVYKDGRSEETELVVDEGVLMKGGEKLDMAGVKTLDPEPQEWHGSLNFSGALTRGNTVSESASLFGDVSRRWEKDRLTANGGYYYAASGSSKANKQKTTSRFEIQGQEDHFWTGDGFYNYVNGKYEYDKIMDLEYRWRVGAGFGYQWLEGYEVKAAPVGGKLSFGQELGMAYVGEKYRHADSDDYGTFRYAHHLKWVDFGFEGIEFFHDFEYLPQVDDWSGNYLLDTDVGATYALTAKLQLVGKVEWDYKRKTAPGVKHSDIRYMLGIGCKW